MAERKRQLLVGGFQLIEAMEPRLMLSAAPHQTAAAKLAKAAHAAAAIKVSPIVDPHYFSQNKVAATKSISRKSAAKSNVIPTVYPGSAVPYGKSPAALRGAYGIGTFGSANFTFNGTQPDGTGQTIAIIDAYDDPNAFSDLNAFSSYFNLPTMYAAGSNSYPQFSKVSETGGTAPTTTDPNGPYWSTGDSTWEQEESLDIEWAHVMAPEANIVLVECNSADYLDLVINGVGWARNQPGVVAISMSFGGDEFSGETSYTDPYFTSPHGHIGGSATSAGTKLTGGVTFIASAGDTGAYGTDTGESTTIVPQYPASSPSVLSVGGTELYTSNNSYIAESAWGNGTSSGSEGGGGGGISSYENIPNYQNGLNNNTSDTQRTYPDLSLDADPYTGVPIYDSWDFTSNTASPTPWVDGYEAGTSLAAPMMAGMIALADQGRADEGLGSLNGLTQTLPRLYQMPSVDFNDITTGNNGYPATAGYDLATGLGSPNNTAGKFILDLAGRASLSGQAFIDANANGIYDGSDTPIANTTLYFDTNNRGYQVADDPTTTTNSAGQYSFANLAGLSGTIRLDTNYIEDQTNVVTTSYDTTTTANIPTLYNSASTGQTYTLQISPTLSTQFQLLINGSVVNTESTSSLTFLSVNFVGSNNLTIDFANGNPIASGVNVDGTASTNGDVLSVLGDNNNDIISTNANSVVFGSNTIPFLFIPSLIIDPRGGTNSLTINAGSDPVSFPIATGGINLRTFSTLSLAAGTTLTLPTASSHANRYLIVATQSNLSINAASTLDLGGNDMLVHGGTLSSLAALVQSGFNGGSWNGPGLASTAAGLAGNTALGIILNTDGSGNTLQSTFDGVVTSNTDVLIKYTYYGDTNLDGIVNGSDYTRTDNGFNFPNEGGWANGDFNYDGVVTGSDYTLIDNAFNSQASPL